MLMELEGSINKSLESACLPFQNDEMPDTAVRSNRSMPLTGVAGAGTEVEPDRHLLTVNNNSGSHSKGFGTDLFLISIKTFDQDFNSRFSRSTISTQAGKQFVAAGPLMVVFVAPYIQGCS